MVATAQSLQWKGHQLLPDRKLAIYDAAVQQGFPNFVLVEKDYTKVVYLPEDEQKDFSQFKEIAAGLGGMGEAAGFLGLKGLASMDINGMACRTLQANHKGLVL